MCGKNGNCPIVDHAELRRITRLVCRDPRWPLADTPVGVDTSRHRHGSQIGFQVCYARRAPLCVVAHELAHLIAGERHGKRWQAAYLELLGVVADVTGGELVNG